MLSGLLNVGMNLFFVLVCGMDVEGVALATMLANGVSACVLLFLLSRQQDHCRFSLRKLSIDRKILYEILYVGVPAGVQSSFFSISNMLIQSSILKVDAATFPAELEKYPVVGGNSAAQNLEGFAYTATNAVYQASVTFTSQNMGAKRYDRIKKIMGACYLTTSAVSVLVAGILILFHEPLLSLYGVAPGATGSPEQIAFESGRMRFQVLMTPYALLAAMEVGSGVLRGLGKSLTSTIISLIGTCVFRVAWIYTVFASVGTLFSIFLSYPISWALCAVCHLLFSIRTLRKLKRTEAVG
jgi:Na+-driven multidrug efflux pump